ncbi:MAG: phosphoribosyltransferase [Cyanobium sp.]
MAQADSEPRGGPEPSPPLWCDRHQAGVALAQRLEAWRDHPAAVVIGLPRGGVAVAAAVAEALALPLASWAVRKLAHPQAPEVAVGAIAPGGVLLWDEPYLRQLHLDPQLRRQLVAVQDRELHRRQRLYGDPAAADLRGNTLLVVDDGIATGLTVRAALESLRQTRPKGLLLAVPVLDRRQLERLTPLVDQLVTIAAVPELRAVGDWYASFEPVGDETVLTLLKAGRPLKPPGADRKPGS